MLLTLLQVSDLHIGPIDPAGTGNATVVPAVGKVLSSVPEADGLIGHGAGGLRDLAAFVRRLPLTPGAPQQLLVTGDFTRCGAPSELALANDYFRGSIQLGATGTRVGLRAPRDPLSVPGNHDQWGGRNFPLSGAQKHFHSAPFARRFPQRDAIALPEGNRLELLQIDSDADVVPTSIARFFARGHFRSQVAALRAMLKAQPPRSDDLCVLVVHHSYSHTGRSLRMQHRSRQELLRLLRDFGIRLVLTGHTHVSDRFEIRDHDGTLVAHELCCGSTSQLDYLPPEWHALLTRQAARYPKPNSLLLHRLVRESSGRLVWTARPHYRSRTLGFRDVGYPLDVVL